MLPDEPIDLAELRAELVRPGGLWRQIDHVAETGSTNADLAAAARAGTAEPGSVLVSDFQSAGRGRLGRTWTAPPGTSIAMSVLVRPHGVEPARWTLLPLLTGLAVAEGLTRAAGVVVGLKWPNDVLLDERKVCGILAERVETPAGPACVIGMGINTHLAANDLPVPTATSVAIACAAAGRPTPGRSDIVTAVLASLDGMLTEWADREDAGVLAEYEQRCTTLGRQVRVLLGPNEEVEGTATGLDAGGRLVVRTAEGTRVFGAGDVVHVRGGLGGSSSPAIGHVHVR